MTINSYTSADGRERELCDGCSRAFRHAEQVQVLGPYHYCIGVCSLRAASDLLQRDRISPRQMAEALSALELYVGVTRMRVQGEAVREGGA